MNIQQRNVEVYDNLRHFPELRQSCIATQKLPPRPKTSSGSRRPTSALGSQRIPEIDLDHTGTLRHNTDKIYDLHQRMTALRQSSFEELKTLKEVRVNIGMKRQETLKQMRAIYTPDVDSKRRKPKSAKLSRSLSSSSPMSDPNNDNLPQIEDHHNKHSIIDTIPPLLMVLRKLEHSGFPGIYDSHGLYCVDRDGLLAVLEIHKRHKRLISPKDLHIRMISILGVDLNEAEYIALHTLLILDQ